MSKTIIERIKSAGETLGVSRKEILEQMIEFYKKDDKKGMKEMFEAYKDWELSGAGNTKEEVEERIQIAKENFDYVAEVADEYIKNNNIVISTIIVHKSPKNISCKVKQFYRDVIGYTPLDPSMN